MRLNAPAGSTSIRSLVRFVAALLLSPLLALASGSAHAVTRVHFEIDMRAEIAAGRFNPDKDQVGIRGGTPLSWQTTRLAGAAKGPDGGEGPDGIYTAEVTVVQMPISGGMPYKFRIERAGQGASDGWEEGPNRVVELVAEHVKVARAFGAPAAPITISRAGRIDRIDLVPAAAGVKVAGRSVQVWVPPGYEQHPEQRYPVLYLHDGQNVFDAAAAGAEWSVDETAQRLVLEGRIQPLIIVAVPSTPQRVDEYTATQITRDGVDQGGKAADYARYLAESVKPEIDKRYRTLTDPSHTAVGGSSLGGIMSLWLVLHRDEVFGAALVVSPSLWWDHGFPLKDLVDTPLPASVRRPKIYMDAGTNEGDGVIAQLRELRSRLSARGWNRTDLNYQEVRGGSHDEGSWATRVEAMLVFLDRAAWPKGGAAAPRGADDPYPPAMPVQNPSPCLQKSCSSL